MGLIRYCEHCNNTKENTTVASLFYMKYNKETVEGFFRGYIYGIKDEYWITNTECPFCKNETTITNLTNEEIDVIFEVSNGNRQLLDAMIELKQKDIIEYELKMAQFRNQAEQKSAIENSKSTNTPKCPKCGSTNIQIVPRKWTLLGGFATKKTDRVCVNCKNKW